MKKLFLTTSLVLMFFISFAPLTYAAGGAFFGPIVPNGTNGQPDCNCLAVKSPNTGETIPSAPDWGCIMQTVQNTVNFAITIGMIIAILYIVYSGFLFVMSAGNPSSREAAKTRLNNVVIGFVVVLAAWLVIDFVMKKLYNPDTKIEGVTFGPWNAILSEDGKEHCLQVSKTPDALPGIVGQPPPGPSTTGGTGTGAEGTIQSGAGCPGASCVDLGPEVPCEAKGCKADVGLKNGLARVQSPVGWTVTEAYPKSRNHASACHDNGTCVDVGLRPKTYNENTVLGFYQAATAVGFRVVYETSDCDFVSKLKAKGVNALCLSASQISAPHFSVYSR